MVLSGIMHTSHSLHATFLATELLLVANLALLLRVRSGQFDGASAIFKTWDLCNGLHPLESMSRELRAYDVLKGLQVHA